MARPSDEERKRRDQRRAANAALRADEAKIQAKVQTLIDTAIKRSKGHEGLPDVSELVEQLAEARNLALRTQQPLAMIAASMATAKLLGLDVSRSLVVTGSPEQFLHGDTEAQQRVLMERIRERLGSAGAEKVVALLKDLRNGSGDDEDGAIDGEARDADE